MGKNIISQKRGRGTLTYRVPESHFKPRFIYRRVPGTVTDITHYFLMDAPIAKIKYENNEEGYIVAKEGMKVGDNVNEFAKPLSDINEGAQIFAIEAQPNSGPKFCRSSGSFAILVSKTKSSCIIQLPSKAKKKFHPECMAMLGTPAGEGRREKPFIKAGAKWFISRKRGKYYPRTSGKKMNAVDHPHGGSGHGKLRKMAKRDAPPGRKVGSFGGRRTGRRKK